MGIDGDGMGCYPLFAAAFIRDMWKAEDRMSGFVPSVPFESGMRSDAPTNNLMPNPD